MKGAYIRIAWGQDNWYCQSSFVQTTKVNAKFHFYKQQVTNKSTSVIVDLLSSLYYPMIDRRAYWEMQNDQLSMHSIYCYGHKVFFVVEVK